MDNLNQPENDCLVDGLDSQNNFASEMDDFVSSLRGLIQELHSAPNIEQKLKEMNQEWRDPPQKKGATRILGVNTQNDTAIDGLRKALLTDKVNKKIDSFVNGVIEKIEMVSAMPGVVVKWDNRIWDVQKIISILREIIEIPKTQKELAMMDMILEGFEEQDRKAYMEIEKLKMNYKKALLEFAEGLEIWMITVNPDGQKDISTKTGVN